MPEGQAKEWANQQEMLNASRGDPSGKGDQPPFDTAVHAMLAQFAAAMIEDLRGTEPGRFARVMRMCELATALQRETAVSVDDFADVGDEVLGLGGPLGRRRFGRAAPVRLNMLGEDQAELARNQTVLAEQLLDDTVDKTHLKALDLLLRMHDKNFQDDKELEEIYALVRTDVLRRLQTQREGQKAHPAQGDQGDGHRKEAVG